MSTLQDGRWFKVVDAACHDGTPYPEEWPDRWAASCGLADECRDEWGDALLAVSWYRTPAHNAELLALDAKNGAHGVASSSQHVEGYAIDLRPVRGDASALYRRLREAKAAGRLKGMGGIGLYPKSNWVHVDCYQAPDGHLRTWLGV
jgi:uncharacterized protein YcbK (DUF882 family)